VRTLLLYKVGENLPELVPSIGDYDDWFRRALFGRAELVVHRAFIETEPSSTFAGVIITGSPRSLAEPEPWMDDAADFVRRAAARGTPVLGVCFGHQLIGHAFGGRVEQNARGWEMGTHRVALMDEGRADPLFRDLPAELDVHQSHRDEVAVLGPGTRVLAANEQTPHQAIAVGEHVRGVQFHPEMDSKIIRGMVAHRRELLDQDQARHRHKKTSAALLDDICETPLGERVLHNFVEFFVGRS
jgi:GMP synthase (glutamine-hydrolysing)